MTLNRYAILACSLVLAFALAPSVHASDQWSWKAQYQVTNSNPGAIPANVILSGGPFSSQQACYTDAGNSPSQKYPGQTVVFSDPPGWICTCDKPILQQGSQCPGFAAAASAAQTATPPAAPTPQASPAQTPAVQTGSTQTPSVQTGSTNTGTPQNQTLTGQTTQLLNPLNGSGAGCSATNSCLSNFVANVLHLGVQLGSVIIILMLVYVGFMFVTARGEPAALTKARTALLYTVIGALILLGAQAIASGLQATVSALSG